MKKETKKTLMRFIDNLRLRTKLLAMVSIPLMGFIFFLSQASIWEAKKARKAVLFNSFLTMSLKIGEIIHELQKERGLSGIFIGSNGKEGGKMLKDQMKQTDQKISEFTRMLEKHKFSSIKQKLGETFDEAMKKLGEIDRIRKSVLLLEIPPQESFDLYTYMIEELFRVIEKGKVVAFSGGDEFYNKFSAYLNFIKAKEEAGKERGTLAPMIAMGKTSPELLKKFIYAVHGQLTYLQEFLNLSPEIWREIYISKVLSSPATDEVERIRNIVIENASSSNLGFNISTDYWFKTATERIDMMAEVERKLIEDLKKEGSRIYSSTLSGFIIKVSAGIASIAVVIFFAMLIANNVLKQIGGEPSYAISVVNKVASGDLSVEVKAENPNSIVGAIGKMVISLNRIINTIIQEVMRLSSVSSELHRISQRLKKGTEEQTTQTRQISTAAEELSQTVDEILRNITNSSKNTRESTEVAIKGKEITDMAVSMMRGEVLTSTVNLAKMIEKLRRSAEEINKIVSIIGDIADQTNLLALNASIEAARAGKHGKGFSVVAESVRGLAEKTMLSTKEISEKIKVIQEDIKNTVSSMNKASEDISKAVEHISEVGEYLNRMVELFNSIKEEISRVAVSVEEQTSASKEIAKNISGSELIAQEVGNISDEIMNQVKVLSEIGDKLMELTANFKVKLSDENIIKITKTEHEVWLSRIELYLKGQHELSYHSEVDNHRNCKLSEWLNTLQNEGRRKYASVVELEKSHHNLHELMENTLHKIRIGNKMKAKEIFSELKKEAEEKFFPLLEKLENEITPSKKK